MLVEVDRSGVAEVGEGDPSFAGERDETADQRDHGADQRDQSGEQRDQSGDERDEAADQRDQSGEQRDEAAEQRDEAADQRDEAADQRDEAADQRDQSAEQSEALVGDVTAPDALDRLARARREAASDRRRSLQDRRAAASERSGSERDRSTSLADRGEGASERTQAELDRSTSLADRGASARERDDASHDDLTGVYLRGAGFVELEREMARARRTEQPLVVAFVDVDQLKAINDSRGHAAGDRMLVEVANAFRAKLRSYDLIIRYGGDEFVCAISGLNMADAAKRVALVNGALAEAPEHGSVSIGLAELQPGDMPQDLVARADAELGRERRQNRGRDAQV